MQSDLKHIASSELVEMLMKNTEYYMTLSGIDADTEQRKLAKKHIDLIVSEIKTREGFKQALEDKEPDK
jgi:hypothetical protein